MKKHVFQAFSNLQNEKNAFLNCFSSLHYENHLFEAFFSLKKNEKKNTLLKRFSSLQNENTFSKRFHIYQMKKKHVFEVFSYLQNEKHINA